MFETFLDAGERFDFTGGGVDRFRVLGIEPSAGLDPTDVQAFVTEIGFTGNGRFTGRMTPITTNFTPVPEPSSLALLAWRCWRSEDCDAVAAPEARCASMRDSRFARSPP